MSLELTGVGDLCWSNETGMNMSDAIRIWQQDGQYSAMIDGLPFGGTGATEAEAIRSLCNMLGDATRARGDRLDKIKATMLKLAEPSDLLGSIYP